MTWQSVTVANHQQLESVNQAAAEWFREGKMVDIKVRESEASRLDAMKSLQHHWYREIEKQSGRSCMHIRSYCKLRFGVPIACENPSVKRKYNALLKPLSNDQKLLMMCEPLSLSVTSHFSTKQMHRYLNDIKKWATEKGYILTTNNDLYLKAMGA